MLARRVSLLAIVSIFLLTSIVAPAAPATADPNEVTKWNRIAVETLVVFPGPAGGAPPASQVNTAMVQGAVYDAVNAIEPTHQPYLLETVFDPGASIEAAVATAAYEVLSNIVSTVPASIPFPNQAILQQRLDTEIASSLGPIPPGRSKDDGVAAGHAAAMAMITARADDGRFGPSQWDPTRVGPGLWQPLVRPDRTKILDPTPWVGGVDPFLMTSSSQFRTDGPQALDSDAYAEDFNEVKALGSVDSRVRTEEQTHIAIFWQSTPVATWNSVGRQLAEDPNYRVDLPASALLFAMMNLAAADAAINCWNDKYYWDFWRPWQAIHEADTDGNPATVPDPNWTSLLTAPYPEHPSGHLCHDGSYLRVLQDFFGTDKAPFTVTSVMFPGEIRSFDRFSEPLKEIIDARIWAGLHFRTADIQAQILGKKVAHYMEKHYFQPLG